MSNFKYLSVYLFMCIIIVSCEKMIDSKLCDVCKCKSEQDTAIVNCAMRYLKTPLKNWINLAKNTTCTKLTRLIFTFKNNDLQNLEIIPKICNTTMELSFTNCNLTQIQYGTFKNLKGMSVLDMSYNKLTGDALKGIFREPNKNNKSISLDLEILNLGYNEIHTLERKIFQHTPKLRVLYLNQNPMRMIDLATSLAISKAIELEVLDLSYTGISNLSDSIFRNLKNLKELYLSGNRLYTVPESLGAISNSLIYLNINENVMEEFNENSFLGLWRLERLEASGIKTLKTIKANTFIQLKSLKILYLSENNALSEINHESFSGLKEKWLLKEIYLNGNNLQYLPKDLIPWNQTEHIDLENNPWMCDCNMGLNLASGLSVKLAKESNPKCVQPLYMCGQELRYVEVKHVCPFDIDKYDISTYELNDVADTEYKKSTKILIIFSITIIMIAFITILSIKIQQYKNEKGNVSVAPIRYTNLH